MDEQREECRDANGSRYWLRKLSGIAVRWHVTADGVSISQPGSYQAARAALDAVAPKAKGA